MGLRRHDVGSESVARMSQGQVVAGLSSIPPSSPPPAFPGLMLTPQPVLLGVPMDSFIQARIHLCWVLCDAPGTSEVLGTQQSTS